MKTSSKYSKSEIMKQAWKDFKRGLCATFKEALKDAWNLAKMMNEEDLMDCFEYVGSSNTYKGIKKSSYRISDIKKARELYRSISGTFASKVLVTIMNDQKGFSTEKQYDIIMNAVS